MAVMCADSPEVSRARICRCRSHRHWRRQGRLPVQKTVKIRRAPIYCRLASKMELVCGVLSSRRYAGIAAVAGTGLAGVYYLLTMSLLPAHFGAAVSLDPAHIAASVGLTVAVSALGGINIALVAYRISRARMANSVKSNSSAVLGGAFAAFTPGCPACTAPLAVVLGAVGGLSVFPMQGLELKLVSAGVLAFSIYWIARGLQRRSCCRIK